MTDSEAIEDQLPEDFDFNFLDMITQETKMSIILILRTYHSLNLRQIATVMGLSEPSCHAHVMDLLEKDIIKMDTSMAGKRGKYYKVNPALKDLFEHGEKEFEQTQEAKGTPTYYNNMAVALRTLALMNQRFGSYAASYIENRVEQLTKNFAEKPEAERPILIHGNLSFIDVASKEEVDTIMDAFSQFINTVNEINTSNENLAPEDRHETLMIGSLIIPLLKLDPRDD